MLRTQTLPVKTSYLTGLALRFVDTLLLWQERSRQRRDLAGLDARALRDIGLSRSDALTEVHKPFWRT